MCKPLHTITHLHNEVKKKSEFLFENCWLIPKSLLSYRQFSFLYTGDRVSLVHIPVATPSSPSSQQPLHWGSFFSPTSFTEKACWAVAGVLSVVEIWALGTVTCLSIWASLCLLIRLELAQESASLLLKPSSFASSTSIAFTDVEAPDC